MDSWRRATGGSAGPGLPAIHAVPRSATTTHAARDIRCVLTLPEGARLFGGTRRLARVAVQGIAAQVDAAAVARSQRWVARLDAVPVLTQHLASLALSAAAAAMERVRARVDALRAAAGQPRATYAHVVHAVLAELVAAELARAHIRRDTPVAARDLSFWTCIGAGGRRGALLGAADRVQGDATPGRARQEPREGPLHGGASPGALAASARARCAPSGWSSR